MPLKQSNIRRVSDNLGDYMSGKAGWKPGQSGNPAGRPPNSVTTLLKNKTNEDNQALADKLWELAVNGDMVAIREVLDRKEGKVADKLEMRGTMLVATPDQLDYAFNQIAEAQDRMKLLETTEGV